eukprot:SAG11_NODE_2418_length_3381_cov_136.529555_2_plen_179_part_00
MVNYQNAKIYKIVDRTNGNIYIGSTCRALNVRLREHEYGYRKFQRGLSSYATSSIEIIKNGNYDILLIEHCPCNTKKDLHNIESRYVRELDCVNKYVPGRTLKENEEYKKSYMKAYNKSEKHKEYERSETRTKQKQDYQKSAEYKNNKRQQYQKRYLYLKSWGGPNNNLLNIDIGIFD